jgi:site-specific DNA-cytosine methylase
MSPPCQPYTRRGNGRDLDDPRSRGFVHLLELIDRLRPPALAVENVPEMSGSQAHSRLREVLDRAGYAVAERLLCPTELGMANRRRRFYLVASRDGLSGWAALPQVSAGKSAVNAAPDVVAPLPSLAAYLDDQDAVELQVAPELLERYAHAVDVVDADDPRAVGSTFTTAYGRSPVRAGSYLRRGGIVRRFSPREILRFLGFPPSYQLPPGLPLANAWRLVGNSLSLPAVREVLTALPSIVHAFLVDRPTSEGWEPFTL